MDMDILELAKDLGGALAASPEFKRLKEAEAKQLSDETAVAALVEFNKVKNEFTKEIQEGRATPERVAEMQTTLNVNYELLKANPVIAGTLERQAEFNILMDKVNKTISQFLGSKQGGCEGCGGSCEGCQ